MKKTGPNSSLGHFSAFTGASDTEPKYAGSRTKETTKE